MRHEKRGGTGRSIDGERRAGGESELGLRLDCSWWFGNGETTGSERRGTGGAAEQGCRRELRWPGVTGLCSAVRDVDGRSGADGW